MALARQVNQKTKQEIQILREELKCSQATTQT